MLKVIASCSLLAVNTILNQIAKHYYVIAGKCEVINRYCWIFSNSISFTICVCLFVCVTFLLFKIVREKKLHSVYVI